MYKGLVLLLLGVIVLTPNLYYSTVSSSIGMQLALVTGIFGLLMFGSSYVEEEHHFWYLVAPTYFLLAFIQKYASHYQIP